ncbi:MAG: hypothetical protein VYD54_10215 [Bdellovibrionota bacterium]|nr:hypothetical protein [Bdellovibrionota bacterium]
MPIIDLYEKRSNQGQVELDFLVSIVSRILEIPQDLVWVFRHTFDKGNFKRVYWENKDNAAPTLFMTCKSKYPKAKIKDLLEEIKNEVSNHYQCKSGEIFMAVRRVESDEVLSPQIRSSND